MNSPRPGVTLVPARQPAVGLGPRATRTIDLIVSSAKELFLTKGYGGTRIDDITSLAGVSRASFYTYFPSKRHVLVMVGSGSFASSESLWKELGRLPPEWSRADLQAWVGSYFHFLEESGVFIEVWRQATAMDERLKQIGEITREKSFRRVADALQRLRGYPVGNPVNEGLVIYSMLHETWRNVKAGGGDPVRDDLIADVTRLLYAIVTAPREGTAPAARTRRARASTAR
ncbi:MAG TPA: TetR/AcrR family transcriptional regulator [Mycobacteriales bacterium]|nr:TetR/AcrR family transcriptional regulator [Mycobacteriales bacterium]